MFVSRRRTPLQQPPPLNFHSSDLSQSPPQLHATTTTSQVYLAAEQGQNDVIRSLCQQAPDIVNTAMNRGATPIYVAAHNGHESTVCLTSAI